MQGLHRVLSQVDQYYKKGYSLFVNLNLRRKSERGGKPFFTLIFSPSSWAYFTGRRVCAKNY